MRLVVTILVLCILLAFNSFAGIEDGLIIYFSFDEIDGKTVINEANPSLNGTLEAEAKIVEGYRDNGVGLNTNADAATPGADFVRVADAPEVNVDTAFTLAMWAKGTSFSAYRTLMSKTDSGAYALTVEEGAPTAWIHVSGDYLYFAGKTNLESDKWYHLALTFDGSDGIIYLGGKEEAKGTKKGNITVNNSDFMIGAEPAGAAVDPSYPAWHGVLDEFYFYNRALSEDEISQLIKQASPVEAYQKLASRWGGIKAK